MTLSEQLQQRTTSVALLCGMVILASCERLATSQQDEAPSIDGQLRAAATLASPWTETEVAGPVRTIDIPDNALMRASNSWSIGDDTSSNAQRFYGRLHVSSLPDGTILAADDAAAMLHLLTADGQSIATVDLRKQVTGKLAKSFVPITWLLSAEANSAEQFLFYESSRQGFVLDVVADGDRVASYQGSFPVTRGVRTHMLTVSDRDTLIVLQSQSGTGFKFFRRSQYTVYSGATRQLESGLKPILQFSPRDTMIVSSDGASAIKPPFAAYSGVVSGGNRLVVARDSSPLIEFFDHSGQALEAWRLAVQRSAVSRETFEQQLRSTMQSEGIDSVSARVTRAMRAWTPRDAPVIRRVFAAPDGSVAILRNDWPISGTSTVAGQRLDLLSASGEFFRSLVLPAKERIVMYGANVVCTTRRSLSQRPPLPQRAGIERPAPETLTCYLTGMGQN